MALWVHFFQVFGKRLIEALLPWFPLLKMTQHLGEWRLLL